MYHAALVGHFSQKHLLFILQYPEALYLAGEFCELLVASHFHGILNLNAASNTSNTNAVMLTLKLHHSRQDGFSDEQLDKLGSFFEHVPCETGFRVQRIPGSEVIQICEPVWQLIAPNGGIAHMYWHLEVAEMITHVA